MRWTVALLFVLAVVAAVWWLARGDGARRAQPSTNRAGAESAAGSAATEGRAASSAGEATGSTARPAGVPSAAAPAGARPVLEPPRAPGRDAARASEVRGTLDFLLAGDRGNYEVKSIDCLESGQCSVELEVRDMTAFRSSYGRLPEPGGFPDTFGAMVLKKPEPIPSLGPKAMLVKFDLLPKAVP